MLAILYLFPEIVAAHVQFGTFGYPVFSEHSLNLFKKEKAWNAEFESLNIDSVR